MRGSFRRNFRVVQGREAAIPKKIKVEALPPHQTEQSHPLKVIFKNADFRGSDLSGNFLSTNDRESKRLQKICRALQPPIVMAGNLIRINRVLILEFKKPHEVGEFTAAFEALDFQNTNNARLVAIFAVNKRKPCLEAFQQRRRRRDGQGNVQETINLADFD